MAVQEFPWNNKTKQIPYLKGHYLFVDNRSKLRPRAAIYASNNLDIWGVPQYTNRDMATAVWLVENAPFQKVYITSLYSPDMSATPQEQRPPVVSQQLLNLTKKCQRENGTNPAIIKI